MWAGYKEPAGDRAGRLTSLSAAILCSHWAVARIGSREMGGGGSRTAGKGSERAVGNAPSFGARIQSYPLLSAQSDASLPRSETTLSLHPS